MKAIDFNMQFKPLNNQYTSGKITAKEYDEKVLTLVKKIYSKEI